ncbi:hypothetical protein HHI36_017940 [Cryptolaemus montrouzieri]|uniref:Uncharacterized protein n=1 Tax=Cryptolaemus montrouzieri TaxID=559131 RepID=A0ABD2NYI0_9CUCU
MEGTPRTKHLAFHCKRAIKSSYNMRGQAQENTVNNTGILLVAPHCIIKTNLNTLQSKATETFSVIGTYNRRIEPSMLQKDAHQTSSNLNIDEEPVLNAPDTISRLKNEAFNIDE